MAKKIIALGVLISFISGGLGYPAPSVQAQMDFASAQSTLNLRTFKLPLKLGIIQERYSNSPQAVLILEDAHAQADAQKNIEKILRYLNRHYGISTLLLEGGVGKGDAALFRQFPDHRMLRKVFDRYLESGELSGSMSAAIFSKTPLEFYGAEDPALYQRQLRAFFKGSKAQNQILSRLAREKQALDEQKKQVYPPELLKAEQAREAYEKEPKHMRRFLRQLVHLNPPVKYPLVESLSREMLRDRPTAVSARQKEAAAFLDEVQNRLYSPKDLKIFHQTRQAFETGRSDAAETVSFLMRWLKARKLGKIDVSPEMKQWIRERRRLKAMKSREFFKQWEAYVDETFRGCLPDKAALGLYEQSEQLKRSEKLARFEISREEWKEIQSEPETAGGRHAPTTDALGLSSDGKGQPSSGVACPLQWEFYRLAEARENVFFKTIKRFLIRRNPSLGAVTKPLIFLAGGFHTEGLKAKLQQAGISYAVLTPQFAPAAENHYENLMRGHVSWRAYFKLDKGKVDLRSAFIQSTLDQLMPGQSPLTTHDPRFMIRDSRLFKTWHDNLIRDVAAHGRLAQAGQYTRWVDQAAQAWAEKEIAAPVRKVWKERVEQFLQELKQLVDQRQLTDAHMARLFTAPALSPVGDKPLVAIPLSSEILTAMTSFRSSVSMGADARSEIRTIPNGAASSAAEPDAGSGNLKPAITEVLNVLETRYLYAPQELENFQTAEEFPGMSVNEALIRAANDHAAGQRVLARRLARFLDEQSALAAEADTGMAAIIGLRLDILRFLEETPEERGQDLEFYRQQGALFQNDFSFYNDAHEMMTAKETTLAAAQPWKKMRESHHLRHEILASISPTIFSVYAAGEHSWSMDEFLLREEDVVEKHLAAQVGAFKTRSFAPQAGLRMTKEGNRPANRKNVPVSFWEHASLDLMRRLVLELTQEVKQIRYREVREKIAGKLGIPAEDLQQPIAFEIYPWQIYLQEFKEVSLGEGGPTLESLYRYLTKNIPIPEHLRSYKESDQKMGLFLEQLGWNEQARLFASDLMTEEQKIEAVIRLVEFLAGDGRDPDDPKRGHRWDSVRLVFDETEPCAIADLPAENLLSAHWISSEGTNMEASRYGYFSESSLRFTTTSLTGLATKFYERIQLATILRALRLNRDRPAFAEIKDTGHDYTAVRAIVDDPKKLSEFKQKVVQDAFLAEQIIFSGDLKRHASSGFLKTNLEEIYVFRNFLERLLPPVGKLQDESRKPARAYGLMTEEEAVSELGIVGLELRRLYTETHAYAVRADGQPAIFQHENKPVLSVLADEEQRVTAVISYATDEQGNILYEDRHPVLQTDLKFDPALDLAAWQSGTFYDPRIRERILYENGVPVFRLQVNPETGIVTAADTLENILYVPSSRNVIQSFSSRRHKLVNGSYLFDPAKTSAADWRSRQVEMTDAAKEEPPEKTHQKEIAPKGKLKQYRRIHAQSVTTAEGKKEIVTSIEWPHATEDNDMVGDHFNMLRSDLPYDGETKAPEWREFLSNLAEPLHGSEIVKRTFYDADIFNDETTSAAEYRPVLDLDLELNRTQNAVYAMAIRSYGYDGEGRQTYRDARQYVTEKGEDDFALFDPAQTLAAWRQKTQVRERTFLDAKGRKQLVVELDPLNPGRILAIRRTREIQQGTNGDKKKRFVEIRYPQAALTKINAGNFNPDWQFSDWLAALMPYELIESGDQTEDIFAPQRLKLLKQAEEQRAIFDDAIFNYEKLQRQKIEVEETRVEEFEDFAQNFLRQGLRPWIADIDERPRDLSRIFKRTMNLIDAYGESLGVSRLQFSSLTFQILRKEFGAPLWAKTDFLAAAKAILDFSPGKPVPAASTGYFAPAVKQLFNYQDKVSAIAAAQEQILKRLGIPIREYEGNFHDMRDASPAMQAAYWAEQYMSQVYGTQQPSGTFEHAIDNDAVSLIYRAVQESDQAQIRPSSLSPPLLDVQPDPVISQMVGWDNHKNAIRPLWNPLRTEQPVKALDPSLRPDILYEIYTLNGTYGNKSRETVAGKLWEANQRLAENGLLVVMLPAAKGLSEEGIEQIEAHYGFKRVEEGIAFNEFSSEYRTEELTRPDSNPDQVLEAEDRLESQKFYVLILQKTAQITTDESYLPKKHLDIKTFNAPIDEFSAAVMKTRSAQEIYLKPRPHIRDLVKNYSLRRLKPVQPESRVGRAAKKRAIRRVKVDQRQNDERDFAHAAAQLSLVHKYRGLLLQKETGVDDIDRRTGIRALLNRTYAPASSSDFRGRGKINELWTQPKPLWFIDDLEPENKDWPKTKIVIAPGKLSAISLAYTPSGRVTAVWVHKMDGKGHILYSEPRQLLNREFNLDLNADYGLIRSLEGRLYTVEDDLDSLVPRRRNIYQPVFDAVRDLFTVYPALKSYPKLETWFTDDTGSILENLIGQEAEDDELNLLLRPFTENRDFVLAMKAKWQNAEKIEIEDAEKLYQLRRMARSLRTFPQLWEIQSGNGRIRRVKSTAAPEKTEAGLPPQTLYANPTFMSALTTAKYVQHALDQNNGKLILGDLAGGALAQALDQLGVKPPDAGFQFYELDLDPDSLRQKRPPRFEAVRGRYYHRVTGDAAALSSVEGFTEEKFDLLTPVFISDFLDPEWVRSLFSEMNRVLKKGGEAVLTLPQSSRLTENAIQALKRLGFEIEVAPMRAGHTARDSWIEAIKEHYGHTVLGDSIAEQVRSMKSKQSSVVILRKSETFKGDLAGIPLEAFRLEKTETGQNGRAAGEELFNFSPEAMRRWQEAARWMVGDWKSEDLEIYDPAAPTLTRAEILNLFPEIESEEALEHLYAQRFIFSSEQQQGNPYELIVDVYTYWKAGIQNFRKDDIEKLAQFYRTGPPQDGNPPGFLSMPDLLRAFEDSADYFASLNLNRRAAGYEYFERNQKLEKTIRAKIQEVEAHLKTFSQAHPLTHLAIPAKQRSRFGFHAQFSALHQAGPEKLWSPQRLAGLNWFMQDIHKPADNTLAAWLENPPDLEPDSQARSEMRTEDLQDSNWQVMLENAKDDPALHEHVLKTALQVGAHLQGLKEQKKLKTAKPWTDPFETALSELKRIAGSEFEDQWEESYGFPRDLPEDPTAIANRLKSYRFFRISEADVRQAEAFIQEWFSTPSDQQSKLLHRIKVWAAGEEDQYTNLKSFNRRLFFRAKWHSAAEAGLQIPFEDLAAANAFFSKKFVFFGQLHQLPPKELLPVVQSILQAAQQDNLFTPPERVQLFQIADQVLTDAELKGSLPGRHQGTVTFDVSRLDTASPFRRYAAPRFDYAQKASGEVWNKKASATITRAIREKQWAPLNSLLQRASAADRVQYFGSITKSTTHLQSTELEKFIETGLRYVDSILEISVCWALSDSEPAIKTNAGIQKKITERFLKLLQDPLQRREFEQMLASNIAYANYFGGPLWNAEKLFLSTIKGTSAAQGIVFSGQDNPLLAVLKDGLRDGSDPGLILGLHYLIGVPITEDVNQTGVMAEISKELRHVLYEADFERDLLSEIPSAGSIPFIEYEMRLEAAAALGKWFYRKSREGTLSADALAQLRRRALHWLDLLTAYYHNDDAAKTRAEFYENFETMAAGDFLPADPLEAVNHLAGKRVWQVPDSDLRRAEDLLKAWVDAPEAERPQAYQAIEAWVDEFWKNPNQQDRAINRLFLLRTKLNALLFARQGMTLEQLLPFKSTPLFSRLPMPEQNPAVYVLQLQMLFEASKDQRLSAEERFDLFQHLTAFSVKAQGFHDLFMRQAAQIDPRSPLVFLKGLNVTDPLLPEEEKRAQAALQSLQNPDSQTEAAIQQAVRDLNPKELKFLLNHRAMLDSRTVRSKDFNTSFIRVVTEVMLARSAAPMEAYLNLFCILGQFNDGAWNRETLDPLRLSFEEYLKTPAGAQAFLETLRNNFSAQFYLGRGLIRVSADATGIRDFYGPQSDAALREILLHEMNRAVRDADIYSFVSVVRFVGLYLGSLAAGMPESQKASRDAEDFLTELMQIYLNSSAEDTGALPWSWFLADFELNKAAYRIGNLIYRRRQLQTGNEPEERRRAKHLLEMALAQSEEATAEAYLQKQQALMKIFDQAAAGLQPLPGDVLPAADYLAQKAAEGHKIWTAAPADHVYAEQKVKAYYAAPDLKTRREILTELKAWAEVPDDFWGNESLSRRYLLLIKLNSQAPFAPEGVALRALYKEFKTAIAPKDFPFTQEPPMRALEIHLLSEALSDSEFKTAFEQQGLHQFLIQAGIDNDASGKSFASVLHGVSPASPLKILEPEAFRIIPVVPDGTQAIQQIGSMALQEVLEYLNSLSITEHVYSAQVIDALLSRFDQLLGAEDSKAEFLRFITANTGRVQWIARALTWASSGRSPYTDLAGKASHLKETLQEAVLNGHSFERQAALTFLYAYETLIARLHPKKPASEESAKFMREIIEQNLELLKRDSDEAYQIAVWLLYTGLHEEAAKQFGKMVREASVDQKIILRAKAVRYLEFMAAVVDDAAMARRLSNVFEAAAADTLSALPKGIRATAHALADQKNLWQVNPVDIASTLVFAQELVEAGSDAKRSSVMARIKAWTADTGPDPLGNKALSRQMMVYAKLMRLAVLTSPRPGVPGIPSYENFQKAREVFTAGFKGLLPVAASVSGEDVLKAQIALEASRDSVSLTPEESWHLLILAQQFYQSVIRTISGFSGRLDPQSPLSFFDVPAASTKAVDAMTLEAQIKNAETIEDLLAVAMAVAAKQDNFKVFNATNLAPWFNRLNEFLQSDQNRNRFRDWIARDGGTQFNVFLAVASREAVGEALRIPAPLEKRTGNALRDTLFSFIQDSSMHNRFRGFRMVSHFAYAGLKLTRAGYPAETAKPVLELYGEMLDSLIDEGLSGGWEISAALEQFFRTNDTEIFTGLQMVERLNHRIAAAALQGSDVNIRGQRILEMIIDLLTQTSRDLDIDAQIQAMRAAFRGAALPSSGPADRQAAPPQLWSLTDEEIGVLTGHLQTIFDSSKTPETRARAKQELRDFLDAGDITHFQTWSRMSLVNELLSDHIRKTPETLYDPQTVRDGFKAVIQLDQPEHLLQFTQLRLEAASDPRLSFPVRKEIVTKVLNYLETPKTRRNLQTQAVQDRLKTISEDSPLTLLSSLNAAPAHKRITWDSIPDFDNAAELMMALDEPGAQDVAAVEAPRFLSKLNDLLSDPQERRSFQDFLRHHLFAKFRLLTLLDQLQTPDLLERPTGLPHFTQALDEMLGSNDPLMAMSALPVMTKYAERLEKMGNARQAKQWTLERAVTLMQSGRPFYEYGTVLISLALAGKSAIFENRSIAADFSAGDQSPQVEMSAPVRGTRVEAVAEFVEEALKILLQFQKAGQTVSWPDLGELTREFVYFAGSVNIPETELRRLVLQVPDNEPLTNNRFKKILKEAGAPLPVETRQPELWNWSQAEMDQISVFVTQMLEAPDERMRAKAKDDLNTYVHKPKSKVNVWAREILTQIVILHQAKQHDYTWINLADTLALSKAQLTVEIEEEMQMMQMLIEARQDLRLDVSSRFSILASMASFWRTMLKDLGPRAADSLRDIPDDHPLALFKPWVSRSRFEGDAIHFETIQDYTDQVVSKLSWPVLFTLNQRELIQELDRLLSDAQARQEFQALLIQSDAVVVMLRRLIEAMTDPEMLKAAGHSFPHIRLLLSEMEKSDDPQTLWTASTIQVVYAEQLRRLNYPDKQVEFLIQKIADVLARGSLMASTPVLSSLLGTYAQSASTKAEHFTARLDLLEKSLQELARRKQVQASIPMPALTEFTRYLQFSAAHIGVSEQEMRAAMQVAKGEPLTHNRFKKILGEAGADLSQAVPEGYRQILRDLQEQKFWPLSDRDKQFIHDSLQALVTAPGRLSKGHSKIQPLIRFILADSRPGVLYARQVYAQLTFEKLLMENNTSLERSRDLYQLIPDFHPGDFTKSMISLLSALKVYTEVIDDPDTAVSQKQMAAYLFQKKYPEIILWLKGRQPLRQLTELKEIFGERVILRHRITDDESSGDTPVIAILNHISDQGGKSGESSLPLESILGIARQFSDALESAEGKEDFRQVLSSPADRVVLHGYLENVLTQNGLFFTEDFKNLRAALLESLLSPDIHAAAGATALYEELHSARIQGKLQPGAFDFILESVGELWVRNDFEDRGMGAFSRVLFKILLSPEDSQTSNPAAYESAVLRFENLLRQALVRQPEKAPLYRARVEVALRRFVQEWADYGSAGYQEMRRIFQVPDGKDIYAANRWFRVLDEVPNPPTSSTLPDNGAAKVRELLEAVAEYENQTLWVLTDEEKTRIAHYIESYISADSNAAADQALQGYEDFRKAVQGPKNWARTIYGGMLYERYRTSNRISLKDSKKLKNNFAGVVTNLTKIREFVGVLKVLHEFRQDPEFKNDRYFAEVWSMSCYENLTNFFVGPEKKYLGDPSMQKLGPLTGWWLFPPFVDSTARGTPESLKDVQSLAELIRFDILQAPAAKEEAEAYLLRLNDLLAGPEEKKQFLEALGSSLMWFKKLEGAMHLVPAVWDKRDVRFENLRQAVLQTARYGDDRQLTVLNHLLIKAYTSSFLKKEDLEGFMPQILDGLVQAHVRQIPGALFWIYVSFARAVWPKNFEPEKLQAHVDRFVRAIQKEQGQGHVFDRGALDRMVRLFVRLAAKLDIGYRDLQKALGTPENEDVYENNIFLRSLKTQPAAAKTPLQEQAYVPTQEEVQETTQIIREVPQHPLWQMDQQTYDEIQLHISMMFEARDAEQVASVYQDFQRDIFPEGLSREQELSRKLAAFLLFFDLRYHYAGKTQETVLRKTAFLFQPLMVEIDGTDKMPVEAAKEQLLLEAARDSTALFNSQQQVLLQGLQRRRLMIIMGGGLAAEPKFLFQSLLNELPRDHVFSFFRNDFEKVLGFELSTAEAEALTQLQKSGDWAGTEKFADRSPKHRVAVLKSLFSAEGNLSKPRQKLIRNIKAKINSIEEWLIFYQYAQEFAATGRQVIAFEGAVEQFVEILEKPEQLERFNRLALEYHSVPWDVNHFLTAGLWSGNSKAGLPKLEKILLSAIASSDVLIMPMLSFMENVTAYQTPKGVEFSKQELKRILRSVAQARLAAYDDDLSRAYALFVRIQEAFDDQDSWPEQIADMIEEIVREAAPERRLRLVEGIERYYQATYFSAYPDNAELFRILQVQDGDFHNNRFRRAANPLDPKQEAFAQILKAVDHYEHQTLWNLREDEKKRVEEQMRAITSAPSDALEQRAFERYGESLSSVDGPKRWALELYAAAFYDRYRNTPPHSLTQVKKQIKRDIPFWWNVSDMKPGELVGHLKLVREFSQDPLFQDQKYFMDLLLMFFEIPLNEICLDAGEMTHPALAKLGELTGRWVIPPGMSQISFGKSMALDQIQTAPDWMDAIFTAGEQVDAEEAAAYLARLDQILAEPAARRDFLESLGQSQLMGSIALGYVFSHVPGLWDENDLRFANVRTFFLEAFEGDNIRPMEYVLRVAEHSSSIASLDSFRGRIYERFTAKHIQNMPLDLADHFAPEDMRAHIASFTRIIEAVQNSGKRLEKPSIDRIVLFFLQVAAGADLPYREFQKRLETPEAEDIYADNVFLRTAGLRLESEVDLLSLRSEVRRERFETASYNLRKISEQTTAYLLQGRMPPPVLRRALSRIAENHFDDFETQMRRWMRDESSLSQAMFAIPEWDDPEFSAAFVASSRVRISAKADVVRIFTDVPQTDALIAAMKNQPEMHVLGLWLPKNITATDSKSAPAVKSDIATLQRQAKQIEYEVNHALSVPGLGPAPARHPRFRLLIPQSTWRLQRMIHEAPALMRQLRGRRLSGTGPASLTGPAPDLAADRLVVVYEEGRIDSDLMQESKSVRHHIRSSDEHSFAKEYLLYAAAAEISEDAAGREAASYVVPLTERHYTFQDERISSDLLASLAAMDYLIQQQFAASA